MATTTQPKIQKDPNFTKGVNLSGLDPASILSKFNQIGIVNGQQKIILSTDTSAESGALNDEKKLINNGIATAVKPPTGGSSNSSGTVKPGAKSSKTNWLLYGGIAAGGLVILGAVALIAFKK